MATATAYAPLNMYATTTWQGNATSATYTYIRLESYPHRQDFYGSFTYDQTGLTGGTINTIQSYEYGSMVSAVTGLSLNVLTYNAYIAANDVQGLYGYVLSGADTFTGSSGNDMLETFAGNDVINSGGGNDVLSGGTGSDIMQGGNGSDFYVVESAGDQVVESAGSGTDAVYSSVSFTLPSNVEGLFLAENFGTLSGTGNASDNLIIGNNSGNFIAGNDGMDLLHGRTGNDSINGGNGDDVITGDAGADTLTGGAGADLFIYAQVSDSAVGSGDTITDFNAAQGDRIDISSVDANSNLAGKQSFTWISAGAFSHAAGELRYSSGLLQADTNGDGATDFEITLQGAPSLADALIYGTPGIVVVARQAMDMANPIRFSGMILYETSDCYVVASVDETQDYVQANFGSFAYNASGIPVSGTVSRVEIIKNGSVYYYAESGTGQDQATLQAFASNPDPSASQAWALQGNDSIIGSASGDVLLGYAGNDSLDGGAGTDTAKFSGTRAGYSIVTTANGYTITDTNSGDGNDGADALTNIEYLQFSDRLVYAGANTAPTGSVIVSGTAVQGQVLTASNTLADVDDLGTIGYQWSSGGVAISGATGSTYTVTRNEVGETISVTASYSDGLGKVETITATPTSKITGYQAGSTGNDNLIGTAYADTLNGDAGNDRLDGGAGFDTAQYSGHQADYAVTKSAGYGYTVTDTNLLDGNDGTDTLFAIEHLQFADGAADLPSRILEHVASPAVWVVVDIQHDFNGDAKGDLWWKQANGSAIWVMDGTNPLTPHIIGPTTGWSVVNTNDVNHDGKGDIAWHNTDGSTMLWFNAVDLAAAQGIAPDAGWPLA